jgi:hypothetical protein
MNTPRTKPPKRFDPRERLASTKRQRKRGTYSGGIGNHQAALLLGYITSTWVHVEESMLPVFQNLTAMKDRYQARIVFRTIVSQEARIKIMMSLLEKAPSNYKLPSWYDEAIAEFSSCNTIRNKYVHGLWNTHADGSLHLTETSHDIILGADMRHVPITELEAFLDRIIKLQAAVTRRWLDDYVADSKATKTS